MESDNKLPDWKKLLKRKLTAEDALIIAVNMIPLIGVWAWGWDAKEMFLVYCLESVIVGLYTVLQMLLTSFFKKRDVFNTTTGATMPGLGFVLFFIVHYGLFLFVQLNIFLGVLKFPGLDGFGSVSTFLLHFPRYLSTDAMLVLLIFVFSYGVMVTRRYIWTGRYKTANLGIVMFTPYPRIFIQQFVVILGSFVLMFGAGASKVFMLIFVIVKLFFELIFDFDRLFAEAEKRAS